MLNLIRLLDLDADAYAIDAGLDENALVFVSGNSERIQQHFRRCLGLDLGYVVSLGGLRRKVGQAEGGGQGGADTLQVGPQ